MSDHVFAVGDWVAITARVIEVHGNGVDYAVELFSKTDQYKCWIRGDLCAPTDKPIGDEPAEGSVALVSEIAYQRGPEWWRKPMESYGFSWIELNALGDVEVIHHA